MTEGREGLERKLIRGGNDNHGSLVSDEYVLTVPPADDGGPFRTS